MLKENFQKSIIEYILYAIKNNLVPKELTKKSN